MTMDHRQNPETEGITQTRALLTATATSVNQLEVAAGRALDRLAALSGLWCPCHHSAGDGDQALDGLVSLTGMRLRFEDLGGCRNPDAAAATPGYAAATAGYTAAVCRDAQTLLRSIDALGKWLAVVTVFRQQPAATPSND
jgi:hypothetical protein